MQSITQFYSLKKMKNIRLSVLNTLEKYGSTQEAFPNEKSFCVTSTLLFDLLSALKVADDIKSLSDKEKSILRNTARFISQNIETHANIGNHLLASLAALGLLSQAFDFEDKKIENGIKEIIKKIKRALE